MGSFFKASLIGTEVEVGIKLLPFVSAQSIVCTGTIIVLVNTLGAQVYKINIRI